MPTMIPDHIAHDEAGLGDRDDPQIERKAWVSRLYMCLGVLGAFVAAATMGFCSGVEIFELMSLIPVVGIPLGIALGSLVAIGTLLTSTAVFIMQFKDIIYGEVDDFDDHADRPFTKLFKKGFGNFFSILNSLGESFTFYGAMTAALPNSLKWVAIPVVGLYALIQYILGKVEVLGFVFGRKSEDLLESEKAEKTAKATPMSRFFEKCAFYVGSLISSVAAMAEGYVTAVALALLIPPPFGWIIGGIVGIGATIASLFIFVQSLRDDMNLEETPAVPDVTVKQGTWHAFTSGCKRGFFASEKILTLITTTLNATGTGLQIYMAVINNPVIARIPVVGRIIVAVTTSLFIGICIGMMTYNFCRRFYADCRRSDNAKAAAIAATTTEEQRPLLASSSDALDDHDEDTDVDSHISPDSYNARPGNLPRRDPIFPANDLFTDASGFATAPRRHSFSHHANLPAYEQFQSEASKRAKDDSALRHTSPGLQTPLYQQSCAASYREQKAAEAAAQRPGPDFEAAARATLLVT